MQASANPAPRSPKPNRRITATQVHGALVMVAEGRGSIRSKSEQKSHGVGGRAVAGLRPSVGRGRASAGRGRGGDRGSIARRDLPQKRMLAAMATETRQRRGRTGKGLVRRWLLDDAGEETDERVFAQLELCARRCAKNDWPPTWRDAPSVYLTSYSRGSGRALRLILVLSSKSWRAKGLPRDRRVLREDAALLLPDVAAALRQASSTQDIDAIRVLAKACTRLLNHSNEAATTVYDCFLVGSEGRHGVHGGIPKATAQITNSGRASQCVAAQS